MKPVPVLVDGTDAGHWEIWVYPNGAGDAALDVTFFRDAPSTISEMSTQDPFGPATATLTFPAVTLLDQLGQGDLWWMLPEVDVDLCWIPSGETVPSYRWEGYMTSYAWAPDEVGSTLNVTCRGAMYQVDNYLAKPEYVYQPIPYEVAIARQFDGHPDLRLAPFTVEWPDWWDTRWSNDGGPLYLRPVGLLDGANWSGITTRSTGGFEQALTGYSQGLLSSMYTERGQFTLALDTGRNPVLRHRSRITSVQDDTLVVSILDPGLKMTLERDFTQRLNVVYGQGKARNGATFSGMRVSADGTRINYEPYAYRRDVHPLEQNDWYDRTKMRKEVNLSFVEGLTEAEAKAISRKHLQRFADPGYTGSIEMANDPRQGDGYLSRQLVAAGMSIQVEGLFGDPDGVLFHITEASVGPETTTLTVDTKYRDQLTVQEVREQTRDALAPIRLLTVGQYQTNIPDMLFPWSYTDGSGFIPKTASSLFTGMGDLTAFPWQDWTRQRPPSDPQWASSYMRIGPASDVADGNWANKRMTLDDFEPHPIRMSQAGEARLIQIAAYDRNGNVLNVPFHVSLYKNSGVSYTSMPVMTEQDAIDLGVYAAGQHYPFFRLAWEQVDENGVQLNTETGGAVQSADMIVGWGTYYEKAGYWPNSTVAAGATPTGLFSDETGFSWDLTNNVNGVDPRQGAEENAKYPNRADIWIMIYCDAQLEQEVFFLGRIWRKEPGTA